MFNADYSRRGPLFIPLKETSASYDGRQLLQIEFYFRCSFERCSLIIFKYNITSSAFVECVASKNSWGSVFDDPAGAASDDGQTERAESHRLR